MSPNSQFKIDSSEVSIIQPSMTIDKITPLKGDDSTATTATMDDNDYKSPEKQQPTVTVMSGTMPPGGDIIESPPQTPKEDTTTAPSCDENPSPGFDEFLNILHGDDKTTPAKSSDEDAAVEETESPPSKEESPAKDMDHDEDSVEKWEPLPTMEAKSPSENGDLQDTSDDKKSVEEDEPKSPQVSPSSDSIDEETTPASPNNEKTSIKEDEQSGDDDVETSPEEKGGEVGKAETNETSNNENNNYDNKEGNPSRRSSSELRNEMGTLLNSVNTVVSTYFCLFYSMLWEVSILFILGE